jgi:shikimate dehydrogenase
MTVFPWQDAPQADFAVIGYPIKHSLSPKMHSAAFSALGLQASYVPIEVHPGEVDPALDALRDKGYRGVNVTVPHKEDAFQWCSKTTDIAQRLHVCNTIDLAEKRGTNTDAEGFSRSLAQYDFASKRALVLGAGGSTRAILYALEADGWEISLWNRTHRKAASLLQVFGFKASLMDMPEAYGQDLIVNTTSASLSGDRLPIDWSQANSNALAYDLAYGPSLTPFLADAAYFGLETMDGRRMLMEQGAAAFEFWWSQTAPRDEMMAALQ